MDKGYRSMLIAAVASLVFGALVWIGLIAGVVILVKAAF